MKVAVIYGDKPDTIKLIPKDLPHVLIQQPRNRIYTEAQLRQIADCDGILATGSHITEQVFNAGRKLKIVQTGGTGYDKVDLAAGTRNGVFCCNNADMNSSRVADFAMMLLLTQFRRYVPTALHLNGGNWEASRIEGSKALEVEDKTLGIIGFGNIGAKLAKRARAFDMKVIYNDILPDVNSDVARQLGARRVEKDEIYRTADAISIHTPLDSTTRGMVGAKEFAMMKDGAFLVLTARGGIVDEQALRQALDSGKLGGASIDVFTTEPFAPDHPLIGAKNINLSPHVAGRGKEGVVRSVQAALANIRRAVEGGTPINILNPEVLARKLATAG